MSEKANKELVRRFFTTLSSGDLQAVNLWADGDWVIAETVGTGPMRNGNTYRNVYAFVLRVEDGVIRELREYMDTAYAAKVSAGPVD
jgi:ketosteroid isomerase-like protein